MIAADARMRAEVDRLRFANACQQALIEDLRAKLNRQTVGIPRRCVYCGQPSRGPACTDHADLVALDEVMSAR